MLSLWPSDDAAGNTRGSGRSAAFRHRVDHDRGTSITEDGVVIVAQSDIWRDDGNVGGAIGGNDERKIRDVAGGGCVVVVFSAAGIEVRSRGLEVWRFAFCDLMDMDGMFAWRKILDVQRYFDPFGRPGEQRRSNIVAIGIPEFDGHRFDPEWLCDSWA